MIFVGGVVEANGLDHGFIGPGQSLRPPTPK
jgi:hypothetical protein